MAHKIRPGHTNSFAHHQHINTHILLLPLLLLLLIIHILIIAIMTIGHQSSRVVFPTLFLLLVATLYWSSGVDAWSPTPTPNLGGGTLGESISSSSGDRRTFLSSAKTALLVGVLSTTLGPSPARATLDIDAFVQKELGQDTQTSSSSVGGKQLSQDEALCRFGQPSPATGEACLRAGISTKLRKGGVDAFGNVESRGDYVRCKATWVDDPTTRKLVKEWKCA